jgi:2-polyprenyl-3-methyl-5-hydroxy-6-metoxy-1,4-benzoquinol methylase
MIGKVRVMEREEWLKQMREKAEILYNYVTEKRGFETDEDAAKRRDETTVRYIEKFLGYMTPQSILLSAGCGTGKYDGVLLNAGHSVVGTDFSETSLEHARKLYPMIRYVKIAHHELDFHNEFDGAICIDTLEHVFPEEWQVIMHRFREALKPGGLLYFTVPDASTMNKFLERSYERAKAKGLPVVFGEAVDDLEECFERVMATKTKDLDDLPSEVLDHSVYHYYPSVDQVRKWLQQERFEMTDIGSGTSTWGNKDLNESITSTEYHFIVRKR